MTMNTKTLITFALLGAAFALSIIAQEVLPPPVLPSAETESNILSASYRTIINNPSSLFCLLALCALAWLLDDLPFINSKYVTHYTTIIGGATYWLFCFPNNVPKTFPHPVAVLACIGGMCGFVAGIVHKQAVARLIEFIRGRIPASAEPESKVPKDKIAIIIVMFSFAFAACAPIQPGADPVVVHTERFLQSAQATFLLTLQVDHQDREFWHTRAPGFHEYCEMLRKPTPYPLDSKELYPQYRVWLLCLNDLKNDYKAGRASSNKLVLNLNLVAGSLDQANAWLTIVSNRNVTLNPENP